MVHRDVTLAFFQGCDLLDWSGLPEPSLTATFGGRTPVLGRSPSSSGGEARVHGVSQGAAMNGGGLSWGVPDFRVGRMMVRRGVWLIH